MEWRKDDYLITDDTSKVQLDVVQSLWLMNYCKIELGKAFCYQLFYAATGACLDPVLKISDPILGMTVICSESYLVNREIG